MKFRSNKVFNGDIRNLNNRGVMCDTAIRAS